MIGYIWPPMLASDREDSHMVKCSSCGRNIGKADACPHCGHGPSQSVVDKNLGRVAKVTGKALEKGVEVTDLVLKETKPLVKAAIDIGKKGARKARDETIKVARSLRED